VNYRERKSERDALKVLLDAMSEQGELSTKDAIFVLQGKLNISKEEARRMLYGLAQSGKLRLLHGKVELS
jgi:DeoR/GlpR family transcriptional regulator of sugar metabolism